MSKYPSDLDDDSSLPSVIDGSTEISGDSLNALKEAVLAIERAIGKNPQGALSDLVSRLAVSINDDGTLKAAALVITAITNANISAAAGISESKLALDFSTQSLKNDISSNDIDIAVVQQNLAQLIADFGSHHVSGAFPHDSGQVLLDHAFPTTTPPWLLEISATTVEDALREISESLADHKSLSNPDAHHASSISVSGSFSYITSSNVQGALEELEQQRSSELQRHLDNAHSNGVSAWENDPLEWNRNLQLYPLSGTAAATVISQYVVDFDAAALRDDFKVVRGEVLVFDGHAYTISDVGPRAGTGSKPTLSLSQLELVRPLPVSSGTVQAAVFGKSSVSNLKVALAAAAFPGTATADSIILARPNAAKVVSLGLNTNFVDSTCALQIEVSTGPLTSKTALVTGLHLDRTGSSPVALVTAQTIADRINYVLCSAAAGNAIPAAAYVIGNELALVHNWSDSGNYWLQILDGSSSAAKGAAILGFGSSGAAVVGFKSYPTVTGQFTVNGNIHQDFGVYYTGSASIAGHTLSIPVSTLSAGILVGHIVHIFTPELDSEIGSYQITAVGTNTIQIGAPLSSKTDVGIQIDASSVSISDLDGASNAIISEVFVDRDGFTGAFVRASCQEGIPGLELVDVSDSRIAGTEELTSSSASSSTVVLKFANSAANSSRTIRNNMYGRFRVYDRTGLSWAEFASTAAIGTGSSQLEFFDHTDEEEMLEIASIRFFDRKVRAINDRRLFGSLGIDELREDVTQAYVETPLAELRSSGVVRGFSILDGYIDSASVSPSYPSGTGMVFIDGGVAYVDGVRVEQTAQYAAIPPVNGNYFICIDTRGMLRVLSESRFSLAEIIEGFAGGLVPLVSATRTSTSVTSQEIAYNIANIDERLDAVLDLTNHFVGNFSSMQAAISYLNAYPFEERARLRIVSRRAASDADDISISGLQVPATIQIEGYARKINVYSDCVIRSDTFSTREEPHATELKVNTSNFTASGLILQSVEVDLAGISGGKYIFEDCEFKEGAVITVTGSSGLDSVSFNRCVSRGGAFQIYCNTSDGLFVIDGCSFAASPGSATTPHGGSIVVAANSCRVSDTNLRGVSFEWTRDRESITGADFGLSVSNLEITEVRSSSLQKCFASSKDHAAINDLRIRRAYRTAGVLVDLGQSMTSRVSGLLLDSCQVQFSVGVPSLLRAGGNSVLDGAILSELSIPEPKSTDPHISIPNVFGFLYDGTELISIIADSITDSIGAGSISSTGSDGITGASSSASLVPEVSGSNILVSSLPSGSSYILSGNTVLGPISSQSLAMADRAGFSNRGLLQVYVNSSCEAGVSYRMQRNGDPLALGFLQIIDISDNHPLTPSTGVTNSGYELVYDSASGLSWAAGPPISALLPQSVYRLYTCDYSGWIDVLVIGVPSSTGTDRYRVLPSVKFNGNLLLGHFSWDGSSSLGSPVDKRYFGNITASSLSPSAKDPEILSSGDLRQNSIFSGGFVQPALDSGSITIDGPVVAYIGGSRFTPTISYLSDSIANKRGGYVGITMPHADNYLYIDSSGLFQISDTGWPSTAHAKIAAVQVIGGIVQTPIDHRSSFISLASDINTQWSISARGSALAIDADIFNTDSTLNLATTGSPTKRKTVNIGTAGLASVNIGSTTVGSTVSIFGPMIANSNVQISGPLTVDDEVYLDGREISIGSTPGATSGAKTIYIGNNGVAGSSTSISIAKDVLGSSTIDLGSSSTSINVPGTINFSGTISSTATSASFSKLTISSGGTLAVSSASTFTVAPKIELNGGIGISSGTGGNLNIGNDSNITGAINIGTASLTGDINIGKSTGTATDINIYGNIGLNGDIHASSDLYVADDIFVTDDVRVGGGLRVTGRLTLEPDFSFDDQGIVWRYVDVPVLPAHYMFQVDFASTTGNLPPLPFDFRDEFGSFATAAAGYIGVIDITMYLGLAPQLRQIEVSVTKLNVTSAANFRLALVNELGEKLGVGTGSNNAGPATVTGTAGGWFSNDTYSTYIGYEDSMTQGSTYTGTITYNVNGSSGNLHLTRDFTHYVGTNGLTPGKKVYLMWRAKNGTDNDQFQLNYVRLKIGNFSINDALSITQF